jgi:hypothetical protein
VDDENLALGHALPWKPQRNTKTPPLKSGLVGGLHRTSTVQLGDNPLGAVTSVGVSGTLTAGKGG